MGLGLKRPVSEIVFWRKLPLDVCHLEPRASTASSSLRTWVVSGKALAAGVKSLPAASAQWHLLYMSGNALAAGESGKDL